MKWVFKDSCKKHLNSSFKIETLDLPAQALHKMYANKIKRNYIPDKKI